MNTVNAANREIRLDYASEPAEARWWKRAAVVRSDRRRAVRMMRLTAALYALFAIVMLLVTDWSQAPDGQAWMGVMPPVLFVVLAIGSLVASFFPAAMQANGYDLPADERDRYVVLRANALRARVMDFVLVGIVVVAWIVGFGVSDSGGVTMNAAALSVMLVAEGLLVLSYILRIAAPIYYDRTC